MARFVTSQLFVLLVAIAIPSGTYCFGGIVLNVDSANKEFFFSGTDTGTLASAGNGGTDGIAPWNLNSSGLRHINDVASDVQWSGPGSAGPGNNEQGNQVQLSGGIFIYFLIPGGGGGSSSTTGDSGTFSFGGQRFSLPVPVKQLNRDWKHTPIKEESYHRADQVLGSREFRYQTSVQSPSRQVF